MHWEESFESVAATHEGLVAKFHLAELACNSDHWWRAIRTGRWLPVGARLIRAASAPASEGQRVLAGVLDASPGAALHGPSALAWLGVRGFVACPAPGLRSPSSTRSEHCERITSRWSAA